MEFIANALLLAATIAAGFYCFVLSGRVKQLMNLDGGLGGAISALSFQVNELQESFEAAKRVSGASSKDLKEMTARAEIAAGRLELLLATLHENKNVKPTANPDDSDPKKMGLAG